MNHTKNSNPHEGYGLERVFCRLSLQFLEDLSGRGLELFLQENSVGKWFCGFLLSEDTPDHTVFTKARKKIGTILLSKLLGSLREQLRPKVL
ncbi:MAG: transposase [Caedimonadaceae bacterium]|nr:MAG: transposase [Caedimonadaceae bacterium]